MKPQTKTNVLCVFTLIELFVVMACAAQFHPPIVMESPFPETGGRFGIPSSVPDVNGDGRPEILICAGGGARGVYLYDGVSRELLLELIGNGGFGIGDVNGDGRGDVVVGGGVRLVYVLNGTTGDVIHTLEPAVAPNTEVRDVSAVPDVNGDGRPEIAIGTINFSGGGNSGAVKIYDGASGVELRSLSAGSGGWFAESVSGIPDVNGDGRGDVIVGAPLANRAYIYDGATGALLRTLTGSGEFGRSVVGLGDVNGDGRGDMAVSASASRRAYIYDGATGTRLHTLSAPGNPAFFGWVLNRLPDVNGDGRDDVAVTSPDPRLPSGNVYVFSGATGELLATLPGHSRDYGRSVAGLPDVNGDGLGEVLVANQMGNSTDGVSQAGQVRLYLSKVPPKPPVPAALGWSVEGFRIRLTGELDTRYELQSSEDLKTWRTNVQQTHTNKVMEFLDLDARNASQRFYRTRTVQ